MKRASSRKRIEFRLRAKPNQPRIAFGGGLLQTIEGRIVIAERDMRRG
jgi:hypothetical protein